MATQIFHRFPELPEELRREIWEWTFLPRLIPLKCNVEWVNERSPPPFIQEVGAYPYENKSASAAPEPWPPEANSPSSAYFTVDRKCPTLSALSVHRESREWARSDGYIAWKMRRSNRTRNIMWNPKKDVVDFFENYNSTLRSKGLLFKHVPLLQMFARQFPFEVTEVRYLSIPSRCWQDREYTSNTIPWPLIDYLSLRESVVVVDKIFELELVEGLKGHNPFPSQVWTLPDDLTQSLRDIRDHYERWWPERHPLPKPSEVRVVMDMDGIFSGEDRHITLRCHPCPALEVEE